MLRLSGSTSMVMPWLRVGSFWMARSVSQFAFAIPGEDLELAQQLLNWENGLGSWRLNRTEGLKTSNEENC